MTYPKQLTPYSIIVFLYILPYISLENHIYGNMTSLIN